MKFLNYEDPKWIAKYHPYNPNINPDPTTPFPITFPTDVSFVILALSGANVAANTTVEQIFAVPGLLPADKIIWVTKATVQAGLGIVGWANRAGGVGITYCNVTAAAILPTAGDAYLIGVYHI